MKKIRWLSLALLLAVFATSCTEKTEFGKCVGWGDDDARDPALRYKLSGWNIAMAVIFSETIIVPIVVVVDDLYCPVGKKGAGEQ